MEPAVQKEQFFFINEIFQPIISKDYRDIRNVFEKIEIILSKLTDQQKTDLAIYIKEMDFQVSDQLIENPKLVKIIQKVIQAIGPQSCFNFTLEITEGNVVNQISTHKILLSAKSEYFRRMLTGNFIENSLVNITLKEIPENIFTKIILFINTGEQNFDDDIEEILFYADMFLFSNLKLQLENQLITSMSNDDIITLWNNWENKNVPRLLSTIIYQVFRSQNFDQELLNKIHTYCKQKGFQGDLEKLRKVIQHGQVFFDAQSQALSLSLTSIKPLPSLFTFLTIDKLYLALKNVSFHDLNLLFQQNPKLHKLPFSLDLDCSSMSTEDALTFAKIIIQHSKNITYLRLSFNQPFDSGPLTLVQTLLESSTLRALNLMDNAIGDHHIQGLIEPLQRNDTLLLLNLGWNQIGDRGIQDLAKVLQQNSTLQELNLQNNRIEDEGGIVLAKALHLNNSLRELNLAWNKIQAAGLQVLVIYLIQDNTLQILNFEGNPIGYFGQQFLTRLQKTNQSLTIN